MLEDFNHPNGSVLKTWGNVVSVKVCSSLCLDSKTITYNSWTFDSPQSKCTCLDLPKSHQCRQLWGRSISVQDEEAEFSISVVGTLMDISEDCTGKQLANKLLVKNVVFALFFR